MEINEIQPNEKSKDCIQSLLCQESWPSIFCILVDTQKQIGEEKLYNGPKERSYKTISKKIKGALIEGCYREEDVDF